MVIPESAQMSAGAKDTRAVRNSLTVLLRIAVLFALTILFLLPYSQGAVVAGKAKLINDMPTAKRAALTCFF
jgi:hypothetical protein